MDEQARPQLLTSQEVGALLRLSRSRVAELAAAGTLRAIRVGGTGHLRFRQSDVLALIEGGDATSDGRPSATVS